MTIHGFISTVILACALASPWTVLAASPASPGEQLLLQADRHTPAPSITTLEQKALIDQLLAQELTYQLDPASAVTFSCNVAALSGYEPAAEDDLSIAATPDLQVRLVVRF